MKRAWLPCVNDFSGRSFQRREVGGHREQLNTDKVVLLMAVWDEDT
jgi:hypothetical protein